MARMEFLPSPGERNPRSAFFVSISLSLLRLFAANPTAVLRMNEQGGRPAEPMQGLQVFEQRGAEDARRALQRGLVSGLRLAELYFFVRDTEGGGGGDGGGVREVEDD